MKQKAVKGQVKYRQRTGKGQAKYRQNMGKGRATDRQRIGEGRAKEGQRIGEGPAKDRQRTDRGRAKDRARTGKRTGNEHANDRERAGKGQAKDRQRTGKKERNNRQTGRGEAKDRRENCQRKGDTYARSGRSARRGVRSALLHAFTNTRYAPNRHGNLESHREYTWSTAIITGVLAVWLLAAGDNWQAQRTVSLTISLYKIDSSHRIGGSCKPFRTTGCSNARSNRHARPSFLPRSKKCWSTLRLRLVRKKKKEIV